MKLVEQYGYINILIIKILKTVNLITIMLHTVEQLLFNIIHTTKIHLIALFMKIKQL